MRSSLRVPRPSPYPPSPPAKTYSSSEIWDRYFWVKYNMLGNANMGQLREQGVRATGIAEFDSGIEKDELISQWNIDSMFEAWKKGFGPKVINYSDTEIIYNIIQHHLNEWVTYLKKSVNVGNAPFRDLVELDMFASVVFDRAKNVFTEDQRESAMASNFFSFNGRSLASVTNKVAGRHRRLIREVGEPAEPVFEKPVPVEERTRDSLGNVFSEQAAAIQAWRKR